MTAVQNRTTRWCPAHPDEMVKRGTLRCRRCTVDVKLSLTRRRVSHHWATLQPMRKTHVEHPGTTKRAFERWMKGYVS